MKFSALSAQNVVAPAKSASDESEDASDETEVRIWGSEGK